MSTRQTVTAAHDDKRPLTVADLRELLDHADRAGVAPSAELVGRVRVRGGRLIRLEVAS